MTSVSSRIGGPAGTASSYIRSHAALRGVAAMLVVIYHLQFGAPYRLAIEQGVFFRRCYLLVDLFFILSGFIISLTSAGDRATLLSRGERRDFFVARLTRLYPLHLFCLAYIVLYTLGFDAVVRVVHGGGAALDVDPARLGSLVAELLLVQAWIPGAPYWNIPSWSISAELFAYAMFPPIIALRTRAPWLAAGLLATLPTGFYLVVAVRGGSLDIISGWAPLRCLSGFMIGMIVFRLRHAAGAWPLVVVAAAQLASLAAIAAVLATPVSDPLIIAPFAILVLTTCRDRGPVGALLSRRAFVWLGERSYSIYLNHVCVIAIILPFWFKLYLAPGVPKDASRAVLVAGGVAAVLLVSHLTHRHVEEPARRWLRRVLRSTHVDKAPIQRS